jgi:hypothetical protein
MPSQSMHDTRLVSIIYSLVEQAIILENNYKEMLLQGEEVDQRIRLWKAALEICKNERESKSCI